MAEGPRWATFDCYGTLIDWDGGIRRELARLFGDHEAPRLLERYHALEPLVQRENPSRSYRDVLTTTLTRLAEDEAFELQDGERDALARSLPSWEPFFARTGADRAGHVHVAASLFHDVAPARELGLRSVWINRLDERADPEPTLALREARTDDLEAVAAILAAEETAVRGSSSWDADALRDWWRLADPGNRWI